MKPMVEIRIPGLDHSLSTEGEWVRDDTLLPRDYDYRDFKGLAAKRALARSAERTGRQLRFGDSMASR